MKIQPVHPKGNQSWTFIGRTGVEAETPILWLPVAKNWLIWKDPDAGRDWRQEEKGTKEDEMVGWHHWLNGVSSRSWRWTGRPRELQSRGVQSGGHDWATELNWYIYIHMLFEKNLSKKRNMWQRKQASSKSTSKAGISKLLWSHVPLVKRACTHTYSQCTFINKLQTCAPLQNYVIKCTLWRVET